MNFKDLITELDHYPEAQCDHCDNWNVWLADGNLLCEDCLRAEWEEELNGNPIE